MFTHKRQNTLQNKWLVLNFILCSTLGKNLQSLDMKGKLLFSIFYTLLWRRVVSFVENWVTVKRTVGHWREYSERVIVNKLLSTSANYLTEDDLIFPGTIEKMYHSRGVQAETVQRQQYYPHPPFQTVAHALCVMFEFSFLLFFIHIFRACVIGLRPFLYSSSLGSLSVSRPSLLSCLSNNFQKYLEFCLFVLY